jgi:ribosomal protein L6P/L9E
MDYKIFVSKIKNKSRIINIPSNLNILINKVNIIKNFFVENKETKENCLILVPFFLDFKFIDDNTKIIFLIKDIYKTYKASYMMFYTFTSKFLNELKGISELYRGTINIQGLGYSVQITKKKNIYYNLFFRFGFKDKCTYIMPKNIIIENMETAKTKIILLCKNLELLKKVQLQIQLLRKPKAFKLQGIYLNDIFPKVKKFVK